MRCPYCGEGNMELVSARKTVRGWTSDKRGINTKACHIEVQTYRCSNRNCRHEEKHELDVTR